MSFCVKCGKKLNEGEVCECKSPEAVENVVNSTVAGAVVVESKKSIPYVSEILNVFMKTLSKNTVKQVSLSSKENSILWLFVMLIENFINALVLTIILRNVLGKLMTVILNIMPIFGGLQPNNTSALLNNIGLGFFGLFFRIILMGIVVFFISSGLMFIILKIFRKQCNFNNVANMVSTAAIPLTFLSVINLVFNFILPQLTIVIYIVAFVSVLILIYLGIQKIDKFTESPFWTYAIFMILLIVFSYFTIKFLIPTIKIDQTLPGIY